MALLLLGVIVVLSYQAHGQGYPGLQKNYRGNIQQTLSGFTCQKWTEQYPQKHSRTPKRYKYAGLGDHNYCRNPDNEPGGAWCYTTNPLQRWDYCDVPSNDGYKCWDGLQKDYRGPLQVTKSGKLCQKWSSQFPQKHSRTPKNYPEAGLGDHNYCRNPDGDSGGAWCYTTVEDDPAFRWEYCDVPSCDINKFWDGLQKDYRGSIHTALSGFGCQKWTEQYPQKHSRTPNTYKNAGLGNHNYCRNPDNEPGGAWCYTTNPLQRWDYCDVPTSDGNKCWDGLQKDYRGPLQVTKSGKLCQKWSSQFPQTHSRTPKNYPEAGLGDHNYCRNPDGDSGGAWCYTTVEDDPAFRWEYCDVPKC